MITKLLRLIIISLAIDPIIIRRRPGADAIPIDNGIEGEPYIICYPDRIEVDFKTRNAFEGHVYVKGHYAEPGCRTDASASSRSASIAIPFNKCGIQRGRSLNPRGVYVRAVVVITFHPQFLTKIDRAYAVSCFYLEAEKTVSQQLEVSELTTGALVQQAPTPVCYYVVLDGGPDGQPIRFATVGQQVYHKWFCETQAVDTYCMLVRNCVVQSGAGSQAQLLDENGCAVDKYLLQNLEYLNDLTAGQEAHVFKFADQPALYFQCQISISVKEPYSTCPRPQCAGGGGPISGGGVGGGGGGGPISGAVVGPGPTRGQYIGTTPFFLPQGGNQPIASGFVSAPPPVFLPGQFSRRAAAALFASGPQADKPQSSSNSSNTITILNPNASGSIQVPSVATTKRRRARDNAHARSHQGDTRVRDLGIWDVDAPPITALEIDENSAYYQTQASRFKNGLSPSVISFQAADADSDRRQEICLNTITFGFIFSVAIAAALAAGTAIIIVCKKRTAKY